MMMMSFKLKLSRARGRARDRDLDADDRIDLTMGHVTCDRHESRAGLA